jgi:hypothetical protein
MWHEPCAVTPMFDQFMMASRLFNLLLSLFLIANAGVAIWRVRDPALKYGRTCLGLVGLGMLCEHFHFVFGDRLPSFRWPVELAGALIMVVGVVALVRLRWKYPDVRNRSLNLMGIRR